MKYVKKYLLWTFGLIAGLLLTVIALQIYYRLTPVELSAEAKALFEETKHMAQVTENGYRFAGLNAPRGISPVKYARCVETIKLERIKVKLSGALAGEGDRSLERAQELGKSFDERLASCAKGEALLRAEEMRQGSAAIALGSNFSQLVPRVLTGEERVIEARFVQVINGGVRGNNPDPRLIFPRYSDVLSIDQERIVEAAQRWYAGERSAAVSDAAMRIARWTEFANGTLIDSMIATAAVSRQLLVLQTTLSSSEAIDVEIARRANDALSPVAKLPTHIGNAIAAEIQFGRHFVERIASGDSDLDEYASEATAIGRLAFDRNDTLNYLSIVYIDGRARTVELSRPHLEFKALSSCAPRLKVWCAVWQRNSLGRSLAAVALPAYADYGKRAHDLRNLAAATRLTIEVRARGLQGNALTKFVASAPADMRDVVTNEPFSYDPTAKRLTVTLQTENTLLGEKRYSLPL
jgi:hypothetical protein